MTQPLLDVAGVQKTYTGSGRTVEAVRDLTFSVGDGELVCIVGPSGAGKTTLLKCIAGLLEPTSGTVTLAGSRVDGPPEAMAVVFQEYGRSLYPWLTVEGNVELPLKQKKLDKARRRELVRDALEAVGLADVHSAYPWQLSGGMQQRVAIARVLANDPSLLLMDEPFGALDALTRADLQAELKRIHVDTRTTVVFVTHSIEEAVYLADRVVVMTGGASHGVPGSVRRIVPVDLADRDVTSPAFNAVKREIADLVHTAPALV